MHFAKLRQAVFCWSLNTIAYFSIQYLNYSGTSALYTGTLLNRNPFFTGHFFGPKISIIHFSIFNLSIPEPLNSGRRTLFSVCNHFLRKKFGSLNSHDDNRNEKLTSKWIFGKWWLFWDYWFFLAYFIVDKARSKLTGGSDVEVNVENERFSVVWSRCR